MYPYDCCAWLACSICGRQSPEHHALVYWFPAVYDGEDNEMGPACEYHSFDLLPHPDGSYTYLPGWHDAAVRAREMQHAG